MLDVSADSIELFGLVPLHTIENPRHIAIRFINSEFSLQSIEQLIEQNTRLKSLLDQARDAASTIFQRS